MTKHLTRLALLACLALATTPACSKKTAPTPPATTGATTSATTAGTTPDAAPAADAKLTPAEETELKQEFAADAKTEITEANADDEAAKLAKELEAELKELE